MNLHRIRNKALRRGIVLALVLPVLIINATWGAVMGAWKDGADTLDDFMQAWDPNRG